MAERELVADMRALLAAMEGQGPGPAECGTAGAATERKLRTTLPTLEDKLGQLLGALRSNGADEWAGKPAQEDLGMQFFLQPDEVVDRDEAEQRTSQGEGDGIDGLMREYLGAVERVWRLGEPAPK
ncbi:uncharacterized protein Tco025E_01283 [Trypanosoma conorhini]|uniref:Uncharacterized protein n=1 Tax=Trypanosoma conorhini TaxID=83891 RepID=A0A422Q8Y4_9TRYP|nr:uncharacterized protein Tco025E_01283 [Trypanosoma conorhini]RNF26442.1 hypothetical protein Tco025E_01283 [Trypanosoma conorhini]